MDGNSGLIEKKIFLLHYFYYCYYQGRGSLKKLTDFSDGNFFYEMEEEIELKWNFSKMKLEIDRHEELTDYFIVFEVDVIG